MVTVGWGHAERVGQSKLRKGDKISYEQAEKYLADDIAEAEGYLNNILDKWEADSVDVKLDQGKYDAMVSMIFNMGIGNFRKTDFIQLVKQGKYDEAAEKILTTAVSYPGHIPRREMESKMFSGEDNTMLAMKEVRNIIRQVLRESVMGESTEADFIAYHGTNHDISKFDTNFLAGDRTIQHHGAGIYFATSKENAMMFGENVYKVRIKGKFIDTDNPVSDVDPDEIIALMKLSDEDEWELEAQNYSPDPEVGLSIALDDAFDHANNEAEVFMRIQSGGWYMYDRLGYVNAMTKLGYAGMIVDAPSDWVDQKHIIVFDPDAVEIIEKVS
jgi:lysozyme